MGARFFLMLASVSGFLSVALGAFGAHGLKEKLDAYGMGVYKTGVEYQFWHSLAILMVGILLIHGDYPALRWVGICFGVGILVFSGSLYTLALTGVKMWGAVTPIGGLLFLAGWALFAYHFYKTEF